MFRKTLQQQPARDRIAQQQQMAGSGEFQSGTQQQGAGGDQPQQAGEQPQQQMGEGSYEGAREYKERTERYLEKADVERDAEAAKPKSEQEAREMKEAEEQGRSHSRGEH
jgi:hypothetical protein